MSSANVFRTNTTSPCIQQSGQINLSPYLNYRDYSMSRGNFFPFSRYLYYCTKFIPRLKKFKRMLIYKVRGGKV